MSITSPLLINEPPLQVLPSLAVKIGLNEAIFVQQLHYWMGRSGTGKEVDGKTWVYNTVLGWKETNFPFWSESTIKRIIKALEKSKTILSRSDLNQMKIDKTKWYTINYEALNVNSSDTSPLGQNDLMDGSSWPNGLGQSDPMDGSKWSNGLGQNDPTNNQRLPEKTNKENTKDKFHLFLSAFGELLYPQQVRDSLINSLSLVEITAERLIISTSKRYLEILTARHQSSISKVAAQLGIKVMLQERI